MLYFVLCCILFNVVFCFVVGIIVQGSVLFCFYVVFCFIIGLIIQCSVVFYVLFCVLFCCGPNLPEQCCVLCFILIYVVFCFVVGLIVQGSVVFYVYFVLRCDLFCSGYNCPG